MRRRRGYLVIRYIRPNRRNLLFAAVGLYAVASLAGPAEEEITAAFEELRSAVLASDAERVFTSLAPEHPLRVEYPTEDALAAAMWIHPMPRAERAAVEGLEVVGVVVSTDEKGVYVVAVGTRDGEDFFLYAEKADGRWVFR
jgi:hypothetical protein